MIQYPDYAGTTVVGAVFLPAAACKAISGTDPRFTMGLSQYSLRALFKSGELDPLDYPQFSVDTNSRRRANAPDQNIRVRATTRVCGSQSPR